MHTDPQFPDRRYLLLGDDLLILKRVSSSRSWTVTSYEDKEKVAQVKVAQKAKGGTP